MPSSMQFPLSVTFSVGGRNHASSPPSLCHSAKPPHIGQHALFSSSFPLPPSTCPLLLQLRSQSNLTTLHSCAPHLQGWHHPSRNQKLNSPWPHLQGWKTQIPLRNGLPHAPPSTTVPHWHPLSVTHQSLLAPGPTQCYLSPLPAPPAANTHLPSLPTRLP